MNTNQPDIGTPASNPQGNNPRPPVIMPPVIARAKQQSTNPVPPGIDARGEASHARVSTSGGIRVNGRELGFWEALPIRWTLNRWNGNYWKDKDGNIGFEGQPAIGNLKDMAIKKFTLGLTLGLVSAAANAAAQRQAAQSNASRNGSWLTGGGTVTPMPDGSCTFIDHEGRSVT